jgi:hypothetical protein
MTEQELWPKWPLKLTRPNLSVRTCYVRMRECRPMYVCTDVCTYVCLFSSYICFYKFFKTKVTFCICKLSNWKRLKTAFKMKSIPTHKTVNAMNSNSTLTNYRHTQYTVLFTVFRTLFQILYSTLYFLFPSIGFLSTSSSVVLQESTTCAV